MTALEYANQVLAEGRQDKRAKAIRRSMEPNTVEVECVDGSTVRVYGRWAAEMVKRMQEEPR